MKNVFSNTSIRAIALTILFIVSGIGASGPHEPGGRSSQHGSSLGRGSSGCAAWNHAGGGQLGVPERQRRSARTTTPRSRLTARTSSTWG